MGPQFARGDRKLPDVGRREPPGSVVPAMDPVRPGAARAAAEFLATAVARSRDVRATRRPRADGEGSGRRRPPMLDGLCANH